MSVAFKCDNCGEFYEPYKPQDVVKRGQATVLASVTINTKAGGGGIAIARDFCKPCLRWAVAIAYGGDHIAVVGETVYE